MIYTPNPFTAPRYGCPQAKPDRFFLAELDSLWKHDPAEAQRVLDVYRSLGFNHVVTGPAVERGYHGHYPDTNWLGNPDGFADFLQWLTDEGMAFSLFLLPDIDPYFHGTGHGWDWALVERDFTPFYAHPRIQALTTRTILAWEQWAGLHEMARAFRWQARLFPQAERLWHNGPGHDSPCNGDEDSLIGWQSASLNGCTGFAFQAHPPTTPPSDLDGRSPIDMLVYDLMDMRRRLHGLPTSPWGNAAVTTQAGDLLTIDYLEGTAFAMYWTDDHREVGPAWGAAALSVEGIRYALDGAPAL